jgi:hypothetical protein
LEHPPPGAGLNLNPSSYQSDEWCSPFLAGSCASLGSVMHLRPPLQPSGRMTLHLDQAAWWDLLLVVWGGMHPGDKGGDNPPSLQSQITSPQEVLQEFASWDMGLLRQWAGSKVLLCQHRLSGLMSEGWALRTKRSHLIYPCKQVTEAKSKVYPYMVIFDFIGYFTLVLCDFPLPGTMWPSSCSDFSGFISLLCHPYLPATFSGLRPSLFFSDPPPWYRMSQAWSHL